MVKNNNREIPLEEYLIKRTNLDFPEQSMFDFLYLTGARITEALTIKAHDINLEAQTVGIHTLKTPKMPYRLTHFYPKKEQAKELHQTLSNWMQERQDNEVLWGFSHRLKPRTYLWELSKKEFHATVHSFRHTHAIILARDVGLNFVELQAEMGWADPGMAIHYLKYGYSQNIAKKMSLI